MIRYGTPENEEEYFFADGDLAIELHQAGAIPAWKDEYGLYFKKNKKLIKALEKLGIDLLC